MTKGMTVLIAGAFDLTKSALTSFSLSVFENASAISLGPWGSRPGETNIVFDPMVSISDKISFCAPRPKDNIKIMEVMPTTIPKIVRNDRALCDIRLLDAIFILCSNFINIFYS